MIGDLSDLGFSTSAQRFVPEYVKRGAFDLLRGFLSRSRWVAVGSATVTAATGIVAVRLLEPHMTGYLVLPLSIAFATLPCYARRGSCCRSFPSRAPSPTRSIRCWRGTAAPVRAGLPDRDAPPLDPRHSQGRAGSLSRSLTTIRLAATAQQGVSTPTNQRRKDDGQQ
jgi:hypothetical protein